MKVRRRALVSMPSSLPTCHISEGDYSRLRLTDSLGALSLATAMVREIRRKTTEIGVPPSVSGIETLWKTFDVKKSCYSFSGRRLPS
jgi:hypothetical protein